MEELTTEVIPFLRWAGGKNWLTNSLVNLIPDKFNDYFEPFVGGGSIFISMLSMGMLKNNITISDKNFELINSYLIVKNRCDNLIKELMNYRNEEDFYYRIRARKYKNATKRAAQFIYLNRTSFNGIYRVNLEGVYNVPYGNKRYKSLFDYENLKSLSNVFKKCNFNSEDFYTLIDNVKKGDLVYLDPPYTVAHENNGFLKYNQKIFSWDDQKRLKRILDQIDKTGAYFIMSNAYHQSILNLFGTDWNRKSVSRPNNVGGTGAVRKSVKEYLFRNF